MIERPQVAVLVERLSEPRRFFQVVTGPRQVGKTTLVRQALERFPDVHRYASADDVAGRDRLWLEQQWELARLDVSRSADGWGILALDEVQKVPGWSETVKRLWDEDTAVKLDLRVVLLGSSPLLVGRGLTESLAGRFEVIRATHWTLPEMDAAFGMTLDEYVLFGGYPGAAPLRDDDDRWRAYVVDSLVETTVSRDVLLVSRVDKPALLRQVFALACAYSGRVLSFTKMLGQLQDAGNTTTVAHYLQLLDGAGLVRAVPRFAGSAHRQRGSIPKLLALNTALLTAIDGRPTEQIRSDPDAWGRLVETVIGAHLANGGVDLFYWREGNLEVDWVARTPGGVTGLVVKSGARRAALPGMTAFDRAHRPARRLLVGANGIDLETFLRAGPASLPA
jgi:predicted AAA+ superfamily ATPase